MALAMAELVYFLIALVYSSCTNLTSTVKHQGEVTPIDSVQTPATGVKNLVKQSKPKIWKVKRSKAHRKIRKSQGSSTVKGQPDTKSHQSTIPHLVEQVRSRVKGLFEWRSSGQGPKFKVKMFDRGRGC